MKTLNRHELLAVDARCLAGMLAEQDRLRAAVTTAASTYRGSYALVYNACVDLGSNVAAVAALRALMAAR